jgi:hypothetical protein
MGHNLSVDLKEGFFPGASRRDIVSCAPRVMAPK